MYTFEFLANAYWVIDLSINMAYIRTIGEENADTIIKKIDTITVDKCWTTDMVLVNDYEDLSSTRLKTKDVVRITDFQESIMDRIAHNKWHFITSKLINYGIIRMYSMYANDPGGLQVIVHKRIKDIKEDRLRQFATECRYDCRLFEALTKDPK